MEDLLARIRRYASRYGLLPAGEAIVVGVSGGPDSLALLHLLRRLSPEWGLLLHVAHLNHRLRGPLADADAVFVAGLAERWGLACTVGGADVRSLAVGCSLEEAARLARYRFLTQVALSVGARVVAVGHNADDQAETVLMHFLRGAGVAGLRGMLARADLADYRLGIPVEGPIALVRPLLNTSRQEIEAYCAEHALEPRFDRSNEDLTIFRNRLRHELLPILEEYSPTIRSLLAHTAQVMAGDWETLRAGLNAVWDRLTLPAGPGEVLFDLPVWRELHLGLQRASLREAIHILRHELRDVDWEHVERAVWLAREGRTGQAATLPAGLMLRIGYGSLRMADEAAPADEAWPIARAPRMSEERLLNVPGVTPLDAGWRVVVQPEAGASGSPNEHVGRWEARLDADAVGERLLLRPRRPGDRFRPLGLGGHSVKLNEFMINEKVPREARSRWPILEGDGGLAWVCGLRIDQRAAASPDSRRVWRVRFQRNGEPVPVFGTEAIPDWSAPHVSVAGGG